VTGYREPNLFLIGAPKCATTSLAAWLAGHPDVYFSPVKDPHWYCDDLVSRAAVRDEATYRALFAGARDEPWRGEGSVWYLYSERAVPRILTEHPDARFVVALRNPIDMARSLHGQHLKVGVESIRDFEAAWRAQGARASGATPTRLCPEPRMLQYGSVASLGGQLERLYRNVDPARVHPIVFDDLMERQQATLDGLQDFLEVPTRVTTPLPHENPARAPRSVLLRRTIRGLGEVKRRLRLRRSLGVLARVVRATQTAPRPAPIDPALHREMAEYFAGDVAILERLLDRPLAERWFQQPS